MLNRYPTNTIHDKAARDLAPAIEAAAPRVEAERRIPSELLASLHQSRLFHMLVPKSVGGEEVDVLTFFSAVEEVASGDASVGWCVGQAGGVSTVAAYLDPGVAREIFGGHTSVVAWGPNSRAAKAVIAPGGYRVTGKWQFASGSRHAQWLGAHCPVFESDGATPAKGADGRPRDRTMLLQKSKARITDVWNVMGLKGTGSDSYEIEDLFVPEEHAFTRDADADRRVQSPLYRHFSNFNMFGLAFAGVSLGVARSMLRDFMALAGEKAPQATGFQVLLRDNAVVQSKVAQCAARLRAARGMVIDIYGDLWDRATRDEPFTLRDRAEMRLASTFAMNEARQVADMLYNAAGSTAIFEAQPFERRFRDINSGSQQGQAHMANYEMIGQVFLGLTPKGRV
jgi:alkylation response protein AidB-like acyl-CoA dehydrogenase